GMPFLLLLVLTLISLQREWPQPPDWAGMAGGIALTWAGVALFLGQAWITSWRVRRRLASASGTRSSLLRRHAGSRPGHALALIGFYLIAVCALGWGWVVRDLTTAVHAASEGATIPGVELLLLAPLLAGLVLSWAVYYDVERAVHESGPFEAEPFPSRWSYVGVQARHNLLLIIPPLVLLLVQQTPLAGFPPLAQAE